MAEIHVKFDTKTKKATATVDGKKVANLHEFHMHKSYADMGDGGSDKEDGSYACTMSTMMKDDEHKIHHVTRLHASEVQGALASETYPEMFEEPVAADKTQVEKDIESFFTNKKS